MAAYALMITLWGVLTQTPETLTAPAPVVAPPPAFELVETEPRRIAYIEHTGPYWSLGPIIDTVARDAKSMGVRGRLVVRYLENSATARGTVHAQVGFELPRFETPKPPYVVSEWPPALVASKSVLGSDGLSPRHFSAMKAWVRGEGLVPAGDLIANVELAEDGLSTAIQSAEIQMPVCTPDPPPAKTAAEAADEIPEPSPVTEPERPIVTKVIELPARSSGAQVRTQIEPVSVEAIEPTLSAPIVGQTPSPSKNPASVEPQKKEIPVRLMIEDGKFADLAAAIMPADADATSKQWSGEIAGRVIALANGVKKMAPGEEGWLTSLADELGARRDAYRLSSPKSSKKVIGPALTSPERTPERKFVMLELDRLMAGLAYGSLTPSEVREKLTTILEVVPSLVFPQ